jgi:hypothetical protein
MLGHSIVSEHFTELGRFNTEFTSTLQLFLSWARPVQSRSPHPTSPRSILILFTYSCLGFPSGLFPSGFPTNNLQAFHFSTIRVTWPAHLILLDLIVEECILLRLYTIKHDNHVTLLSTIYSRANTTHVLFSQHVSVVMCHHQVKPNTIHQITSRY